MAGRPWCGSGMTWPSSSRWRSRCPPTQTRRVGTWRSAAPKVPGTTARRWPGSCSRRSPTSMRRPSPLPRRALKNRGDRINPAPLLQISGSLYHDRVTLPCQAAGGHLRRPRAPPAGVNGARQRREEGWLLLWHWTSRRTRRLSSTGRGGRHARGTRQRTDNRPSKGLSQMKSAPGKNEQRPRQDPDRRNLRPRHCGSLFAPCRHGTVSSTYPPAAGEVAVAAR